MVQDSSQAMRDLQLAYVCSLGELILGIGFLSNIAGDGVVLWSGMNINMG